MVYVTELHCFKNTELFSLYWTALISTRVVGKNKAQLYILYIIQFSKINVSLSHDPRTTWFFSELVPTTKTMWTIKKTLEYLCKK